MSFREELNRTNLLPAQCGKTIHPLERGAWEGCGQITAGRLLKPLSILKKKSPSMQAARPRGERIKNYPISLSAK